MKRIGRIRLQKLERAVEYLRDALSPLPPGGKLPSIRTMMEETGTGQLTMAHALERLQKEGLIRIEPRLGVFRVGKAPATDDIRLIHFQKGELASSTFIADLFQELIRLAQDSGRRITIRRAGHRTAETIARELEEQGIARCIL